MGSFEAELDRAEEVAETADREEPVAVPDEPTVEQAALASEEAQPEAEADAELPVLLAERLVAEHPAPVGAVGAAPPMEEAAPARRPVAGIVSLAPPAPPARQ